MLVDPASFKFNLLSINKLIKETGLLLIFLEFHCVIHGSRNRETIVVAEAKKNLYILEEKSFDPCVIRKVLSTSDHALFSENHVLSYNSSEVINGNSVSLWHQ